MTRALKSTAKFIAGCIIFATGTALILVAFGG